LRTGIPEFRLPAEVVDREIERILDLGVEVITDLAIERSRLFDVARSHDAVLVATGLQALRGLRLNGSETAVPVQGIDFLEEVRRGRGRMDGEDVIVVGGGNTAMDAARSALRGGATSVRVLYRRTRAEMPAIAEEVDEALEEGVTIDFLVQPVAASDTAQSDGDSSRYTLQCRRMELGEPDASGRRRPVEIPDSDFDVSFTRLILALGQSADLSLFPENTDVREGEPLPGPFASPVYVLGDLATGEGTVAAAIGSGRRAALRLHEAFTGESVETGEHTRARSDVDVWHDEVIPGDALRLNLFESQPASTGSVLAIGRRRTTFEEVHHGLPHTGEARRCLSCGVCNECDICVTYCPEGVLQREGGEMVFDYAYCKGCGICVAECPRNVLFMSQL
jgi:ferredoxin